MYIFINCMCTNIFLTKYKKLRYIIILVYPKSFLIPSVLAQNLYIDDKQLIPRGVKAV